MSARGVSYRNIVELSLCCVYMYMYVFMRERERALERERERERERGREGEREREGGRERDREGGKEGERESSGSETHKDTISFMVTKCIHLSSFCIHPSTFISPYLSLSPHTYTNTPGLFCGVYVTTKQGLG